MLLKKVKCFAINDCFVGIVAQAARAMPAILSKVTQHMSKDGLRKENQTTGKTERVSGRETEQNFSPGERSVRFCGETEKAVTQDPNSATRLQGCNSPMRNCTRRSCNRISENPINKRIGWTKHGTLFPKSTQLPKNAFLTRKAVRQRTNCLLKRWTWSRQGLDQIPYHVLPVSCGI